MEFDRSSAATGPAFTQEIMQKLREQAQELGSLRRELASSRAYGRLCEQRILDLVPEHPLPVAQAHLGQKPASDGDASRFAATAGATTASLRQELQEQRLYIQMLEDEAQAAATGAGGVGGADGAELLIEVKRLRADAARAQDLLLQQRRHGERLERELQDALYANQQLNDSPAVRQLATLRGQVGELETEKQALLGYVQDTMQRTAELQRRADVEAGAAAEMRGRATAAEADARWRKEEAERAEAASAAAVDAQRRLEAAREEVRGRDGGWWGG
jgi:hypothetical protein